jgi:hypothetical protein
MAEPKIVQIASCSGWSYRFRNLHEDLVTQDIAAWALLEDGSVVGLVANPFGGASDATVPRLVTAPIGKEGCYLGPSFPER